MNGFFKRDEKIAYFKLMKLKLSRDEKKVWGEKLWYKLEEWEWGGGWGKCERNKEGGVTIHHHPFVSTPYNYEFANDGKVFLFKFFY
jgi:hypothetical protein